MFEEGKTRIVFTGDIAFSRYFQNAWKDDGCLEEKIKLFLKEADSVVANLECPLTNKVIVSERPLNHVGEPGAGGFLSKLNMNVWNLANNHIMDCGDEGLLDTLNIAKGNDCRTIGAGSNLEEALRPIILGDTVKVGVLSVASATWKYLMADFDTPGVVTWEKTEQIKKVIDGLRPQVDWIVLVVHGGDEYCDMALPYIKEKYHALLNLGADIIVGHHPHVVQNYECINQKIIFYSLGNFIFDTENQREFAHTDNGVLVGINFDKDSYSFDALPIHINRDGQTVLEGELPPVFREIDRYDYSKLWRLEAQVFYPIDLQKRKKISPRLRNANRLVFWGHEVLACRNKRERQIQKGRILSFFYCRNDSSLSTDYGYLIEGLSKVSKMGPGNKMNLFFAEEENKMGELTRWKKIRTFLDCFYVCKIKKIPQEEYFKYEFYKKDKAGRESFATLPKRRAFYNRFNPIEERKWFDNKNLFSERFNEFIGREEINFKTVSEDEFCSFVGRHHKIFLKPDEGHYGIGTQVIEIDEEKDLANLFEEYHGKPFVAEELICQASELAEFNDSSVNSMRVMTFLHRDGTVEIVPYAALRLGRRGKTVDNYHNDGISAMIDSATGCVITVGLDRHGNRWVVHPDSEKPIVGFLVPHWENICECVSNAALVCPEIRFVGWDVSVTDDGRVILIEGNSRPDPDVIQAVDGIGKWYIYQNYIDEENSCC